MAHQCFTRHVDHLGKGDLGEFGREVASVVQRCTDFTSGERVTAYEGEENRGAIAESFGYMKRCAKISIARALIGFLHAYLYQNVFFSLKDTEPYGSTSSLSVHNIANGTPTTPDPFFSLVTLNCYSLPLGTAPSRIFFATVGFASLPIYLAHFPPSFPSTNFLHNLDYNPRPSLDRRKQPRIPKFSLVNQSISRPSDRNIIWQGTLNGGRP